MIHIYTKTLVHFRCSSLLLHSSIHKLYYSSSLKPTSISPNQHSFTVNYLINSCGLSPETAISASKRINLKTLEKPDSVLNFFKNHGFTMTQISTVIRKRPKLLLADPENTLLPKFEFFYSAGISSTELAKTLSSSPQILAQSLNDYIIPSFNLLRSLFPSDDEFTVTFKRCPWIVMHCSAHTLCNIESLRRLGVPDLSIVHLHTGKTRSFNVKPEKFNELVEDIKNMGFNPSKTNFVVALNALTSLTKSTWKRKMEVYEKWGWSKEKTLSAFRRCPWCMIISEEKIMATMTFFVNTMGWESSIIAHRPNFMLYSLDKRIIPRCSVLQVLLSKGLIKEPVRIWALLESTERVFLERFVTCYEEAPQLLKLYQEKMDLPKSYVKNYEGKVGACQL